MTIRASKSYVKDITAPAYVHLEFGFYAGQAYHYALHASAHYTDTYPYELAFYNSPSLRSVKKEKYGEDAILHYAKTDANSLRNNIVVHYKLVQNSVELTRKVTLAVHELFLGIVKEYGFEMCFCHSPNEIELEDHRSRPPLFAYTFYHRPDRYNNVVVPKERRIQNTSCPDIRRIREGELIDEY